MELSLKRGLRISALASPPQDPDHTSKMNDYKKSVCSTYKKIEEYNSGPGESVLLADRYTELLIVETHRKQREREEDKLLNPMYSTQQSKEHLDSLRSFLHSSPGVGEVDLDFRYIPDPWATALIRTYSTTDETQQDPPAKHQSSLRRSCQSCSDIPDSTHWDLMMPSISMETGVSVYNLSSEAGCYECTVSGLRWVCGGDVTLQYHFSTEELFSAQLEVLQYRPIGHLMDIKVLSGELDEIHLPHSLCLGDSDTSKLSDEVRVLHGHDGVVSLETCELMRFHARLVKPSFSLFGLLVRIGIPIKIHFEVLTYQSHPEPLILNTYVVPRPSTVKNAIEEEWKSLGGIYISKEQPITSIWINSNFKLSTSCTSEIIPEEISLTCNTSPAYFEVCIKKPDDEFEMELMVAEDRPIWKAAFRKTVDYKTAMPTRSADQGGAESRPTARHLSLEVEQRKDLEDMFYDSSICKKDDEDMKTDQQEWDKLMASVEETRAEVKDVHDVVDNTNEKVSAMQRDLKDIKDQVGTHEGAGPKSSSASLVKARDKVKKSRIKLNNRIGKALLKDLLNHLQEAAPDQPPVISRRESNHVLEQNSATENRVTCLVDMVWKKGERACEIFLSLLSEHDMNLYKELGL